MGASLLNRIQGHRAIPEGIYFVLHIGVIVTFGATLFRAAKRSYEASPNHAETERPRWWKGARVGNPDFRLAMSRVPKASRAIVGGLLIAAIAYSGFSALLATRDTGPVIIPPDTRVCSLEWRKLPPESVLPACAAYRDARAERFMLGIVSVFAAMAILFGLGNDPDRRRTESFTSI